MLQLFKNDCVTAAALKQAEIRQKELDFYMNNYMTWGGTSTVMAGFVFGQLTDPVPEGTNVVLETTYLIFISTCLSLNLCVITWTVLCCIWGPGLAMRGPDGMKSFHKVVDFLKQEQNTIYNAFIVSVFCYFGATCTLVWVYPSDTIVNMAMMICLGSFLVIIIISQVRLEMRIGGSFFSHDGADGRIQAFGAMEDVADLDNFISQQGGPDAFATQNHPGLY